MRIEEEQPSTVKNDPASSDLLLEVRNLEVEFRLREGNALGQVAA